MIYIKTTTLTNIKAHSWPTTKWNSLNTLGEECRCQHERENASEAFCEEMRLQNLAERLPPVGLVGPSARSGRFAAKHL